MIQKLVHHFFEKSSHIAPLAIFRIVFGAIMSISMIRFLLNGWVFDLYVAPKMFFPYYGFEWVKPLPEFAMYALFIGLAITFFMQAIGLFYKAASIFNFIAFTYIELIDKTNYLNHYYFVSLVCFLLIFVPAHRYFSLDILRKPFLKREQTSAWHINIFKFQLFIVYFFAGLAKLNYDWLIEAMPLKIWLPSKSNLWLIGEVLKEEWVAYLFSWFGAIYDLSIPFLLLFNRSRFIAYLFVIIFHVMTWVLFNIGMFPFIMIGATIIFFPSPWHQKVVNTIAGQGSKIFKSTVTVEPTNSKGQVFRWTKLLVGVYMLFQIAIPLRFLSYDGKLFWNEDGYRFSWRVMLMEKAGYVTFKVTDPKTKAWWEVNNYDFLTPNQEKMMSTQSDMILQFAHYLKDHYNDLGIEKPIINANAYVSFNGQLSQAFINPNTNLAEEKESLNQKSWIIPYNSKFNP